MESPTLNRVTSDSTDRLANIEYPIPEGSQNLARRSRLCETPGQSETSKKSNPEGAGCYNRKWTFDDHIINLICCLLTATNAQPYSAATQTGGTPVSK